MAAKVPQLTKTRKPRRPEDFDGELLGRRVSVKLVDGEWITGTLEQATRFWLKLRANGGPVYVNKSHVVEIVVDGGGRG